MLGSEARPLAPAHSRASVRLRLPRMQFDEPEREVISEVGGIRIVARASATRSSPEAQSRAVA